MRFKSALASAAVAVPVLMLLLWLAGCDFTHVDEPSHVPIKQVLTSLDEANTEAEMEEAVDRLLGKVAIGTPGKEGPYSHYKLTDDEKAQLVRAQLAFKTGTQEEVFTFGGAYELVKQADAEARTVEVFSPAERPLLTVSKDYVLKVLKTSVNAALKTAETPNGALLVALAADGGDIPQEAPVFEADTRISPMQRFLFGVWFHYYAPAMSDAQVIEIPSKSSTGGGGNNKNECPDGYRLIDKFESPENGNGMTWEKGAEGSPTITLSNFTYKDGNEVATFDWTSSKYYVDIVQFKGGTNIAYELVPRVKSGSVSYVDVDRLGISNVLFCQAKHLETCRWHSVAAYLACKCAGGDINECKLKLKENLEACEHEQGNIY